MKKYAIISVLAVIFFAGFAHAEIVQINIEAEVTSVDDSGNYLEGNINVGDTITGYYTYDTDTPDSNPDETAGEYWHYSSPFGVYLACNDLEFQTDPKDTEFLLHINDDSPIKDYEGYTFRSYSNSLLSNGSQVDHISLGLKDYDCSSFVNDELITYAPDLSEWEFNDLSITGDRMYNIGAEVTSATKVPEPSTILLFGLSSLFLKRKNK